MPERLRDRLAAPVVTLQTLSDLAEFGLEKSARCAGLILCSDETTDLAVVLETLGRQCRQNAGFLRNPLPVALLSAKRNPSIDRSAVARTIKNYPIRIRELSIPAIAARRLLRRYPLHLGADCAFGQVLHVLVEGSSDLGIAIALQAMRMAHYGTRQPRFTLAAPEPKRVRDDLLSEFPEALSVGEFEFVDLDLTGLRTDLPVTTVYLCDHAGVGQTARIPGFLDALRRHQGACPPIFTEIDNAPTTRDFSAWDGQIYPFSALSDICDPEVLFGESEDDLAVVVHDYYRDSIAAQGRPLEGSPAGEPWTRLEESYRQASRYQADHMAAKVAAIDCRIVPEQESEFFVFYPREVEKLARIEHDRWSADRYLNGWKFGPLRDNEKKIHPELIPFDRLSEDMKDLDRYTVRLMPALLGRKGLAIRRNLIVAVTVSANPGQPGPRYIQSVDTIFKRLTDRYPDRTLVLAIDLADEIQLDLQRRVNQRFRAAYWSLIGGPLDRLLTSSKSNAHRIARLEILALSERRICLAGPGAVTEWQSRRADVVLLLGPVTSTDRTPGVPGFPTAEPGQFNVFQGLRQIRLDPETGHTGWSFEY